MASIFDHIDPREIAKASPEAQKLLRNVLLGIAMESAKNQPEESAIEAHLIDVYNRLDDALHETFKMYGMPITPALEGGKELRKELLPRRKEFLKFLEDMLTALQQFPVEHPLPEIPQKFKDFANR